MRDSPNVFGYFKQACVPLLTEPRTKMHKQYEQLLTALRLEDKERAEYIDEEINIIIHKLKYIPIEGRPSVLMIDDVRMLNQDFSPLTKESILIAGGQWIDVEEVWNAEKIIVVEDSLQLYSDLPHLLSQTTFSASPAVQKNEVYIIQNGTFGTDAKQFLLDVEILAEIIQPKYFVYGHQGDAWVQFGLG